MCWAVRWVALSCEPHPALQVGQGRRRDSRPHLPFCWFGTHPNPAIHPPTSTTRRGKNVSPPPAGRAFAFLLRRHGTSTLGQHCWNSLGCLRQRLDWWMKRPERTCTGTCWTPCPARAKPLFGRRGYACWQFCRCVAQTTQRCRQRRGFATGGRVARRARVRRVGYGSGRRYDSGFSRERSIGLASNIKTPGKNKLAQKPWRNMIAPLPHSSMYRSICFFIFFRWNSTSAP